MSDFLAIVGAFLAVAGVLLLIAFVMLLGAAVVLLLFRLCTKKGREKLRAKRSS